MSTDDDRTKRIGLDIGRWRQSIGFSMRQLDIARGKAPGSWSQVEGGAMLPPGRTECDAIDAARGSPVGTTWRELAPLRLERIDPDLLAWARDNGASTDALALGEVRAENAALRARLSQIAALATTQE